MLYEGVEVTIDPGTETVREKADKAIAKALQEQDHDDPSQIKLNQSDLQETGTFVSRPLKTPWFFARTYPKLFPPIYVDGKFVISCEWNGPRRFQSFDFSQFVEHLTWNGDPRFENHPTLKFLLNNLKSQEGLLNQAFFAVKAIPGVPNLTKDDLQEQIKNKKFSPDKELLYYAGNVPGNDAYWGARANEVHHYASFLGDRLNRRFNIFHTLSMAESHWYPLQQLLYQHYIHLEEHLRGLRPEEILTNAAVFQKAVQRNLNIVTHYFAARCEHWFFLLLEGCLDVEEYWLRFEFAKSRG
eukprot:Lithocolla_globosa_v1_NODE_96_length_6498_cov_20.614310.p3 type:complete len:299 gc:universal NODE_96_length_6498_cov_20.614310:85-981(+)